MPPHNSDKPVIFLSHSSDDRDIAIELENLIHEAFNEVFEVFNSSNDQSITGGEAWRKKLVSKLREATAVLVIFTPESVSRPWVNFEAGGALMLEKEDFLIPCCANGLTKSNLPSVINDIQGILLYDWKELQTLVDKLATLVGQRVRRTDTFFKNYAEKMRRIEVMNNTKVDPSRTSFQQVQHIAYDGGMHLTDKYPDDIVELVSKSKEVWLAGITLTDMIDKLFVPIQRRLQNQEITVRFLFVDPNGEGCRVAVMRSLFLDIEKQKTRIEMSIDTALQLKKVDPAKVEVRATKYTLPYESVFINTGDDVDATIFIRHYGYKTAIGTEPRLVVKAQAKKWFNFYKEEISNFWEYADELHQDGK